MYLQTANNTEVFVSIMFPTDLIGHLQQFKMVLNQNNACKLHETLQQNVPLLILHVFSRVPFNDELSLVVSVSLVLSPVQVALL